MRATLVGQSGSRKPLLRPRRTTQRTGVIGGRPAPLLLQNWCFTSATCKFSKTCVFDDLCDNSALLGDSRSPGTLVSPIWACRPDGVHIYTKANAHRFWVFLEKLHASAAGNPFWVARVVSLRPPAPLGRPGPQKQPRGTPRKRFGSSWVVSWRSPGPPLGGLRARPKVAPKTGPI
jgi:hypothetical protein